MEIKITPAQVASFIVAGAFACIAYAIIVLMAFAVMFSLRNYSPAEQLTEDALVFFFSAIASLLALYVAIKQYSAGRKFTAAGIATASLFIILATTIAGKTYFNTLNEQANVKVHDEIRNPAPSQNNTSAYP